MIELSFISQKLEAAEPKETYTAVEGFHRHKTTAKVSCFIIRLILMLSDTEHADRMSI